MWADKDWKHNQKTESPPIIATLNELHMEVLCPHPASTQLAPRW